ncbi:unnamed protein product [Chironomus riparius]|uniref:TRUD domain-containing protein n=1 Tax=Chironomus riparius TaxID=315576 RepID=A0A9N9RN79_9DIPT|nr:unnamed protein product [Chironomus riparius]
MLIFNFLVKRYRYSIAAQQLNLIMGRDHQKFHNKHRFNKNKGNFNQNYDKSWQTDKRLLECDVGIVKYISDIEGFHGIIKARFSDFHVNEIDLDGKEATLTDFAVPQLSDFEVPTDNTVNIKEFLDDEKAKEIEELINNEDYHKSVLIEVTDFDKDRRSSLHQALRKVYGKKLSNNTISTGTDRKFIQVKKFSKGDQDVRGWKWPHEFTYFVLYKENLDTMQAVSLLAKNLKIKSSLLSFAGTKDKRAKTTQWVCAKKVEPSKICQASCRIKVGGKVKVGNFKFNKKPLKLGELSANRFQIALRSVKGEELLMTESLKSIQELGFINYYGMQRFGNCITIPTFEVGKALLRSDFKEAVDLILKEREGEPPFMAKMRACWKETRDAQKALKMIDNQHSTYVEAKLLSSLVKLNSNGNYNYLQALQTLPKNMLMLYTHAYQSLIFNQVVSKRRELGLSVLEGDLVFRDATNVVEQETVIIEDITEDDNDKEIEIVEPESKFKEMVRPLTKEDVESGKYSIFDIVLVLPGHDITYPSNAIGDYYTELMNKDDLSSEKLKSKHKMFSLCGAYRKAFVKPQKFSWKFLKYADQNDDLILSDYSRMMKDPEIESNKDGQNTALILDFSLPTSCYATMLLRELLKSDTSSANQMLLQKELTSANETESSKRKIEDTDIVEDEPSLKKIATEAATN